MTKIQTIDGIQTGLGNASEIFHPSPHNTVESRRLFSERDQPKNTRDGELLERKRW